MNNLLTSAEAIAVLAMIMAANNVGGEFDLRMGHGNATRVSYNIHRESAIIVEIGTKEESFSDDIYFGAAYGLN